MSTQNHIVPDLEDILENYPGWLDEAIDTPAVAQLTGSYCQIWCLRFVGHAAIWSFCVVSIPSLNLTPVMTLAR